MLVLSRHINEEIVINGNIVITVIDIRGGSDCRVRLGIDAPKDIIIDRREIHEARLRDRGEGRDGRPAPG